MLSDMRDDLVRADCPQEKEAAYRQLEKLGVDRITADVIADERRKEAHLGAAIFPLRRGLKLRSESSWTLSISTGMT